ncbi:MAG: cyclic nucleotide-binding domain-containing protein [Acidobacteriota bacterium]
MSSLQGDGPPIDLDLLTTLAKRFADHRLTGEAAELFEMALRLDPTNRGVHLALASLRKDLRSDLGAREKSLEEELRKTYRRNSIDACHFFGLAALYEERGKAEPSRECLGIALAKEPIHPFAFKLQGRLLYRAKEYDRARDALRTAQRYNPFDRGIAELLGRVEYELERYRDALEATIDAFLLLREDHTEDTDRLKDHIRTLKQILSLDSDEVREIFRQRRQRLETAFDRLELQRERHLEATTPTSTRPDDPEKGRILLAGRLRELDAWSLLNDEQIFQLTRVVEEVELADGAKLFSYGDTGRDLYVLAEGQIVIRHPTHYGSYLLARLESGTLLGEVGFVSQIERTGDAFAEGSCHLLRLDAGRLETLLEERPDIGVKIYTSFWQVLADKLRGANEQLRTFFTGDEPSPHLLQGSQEGAAVDIAAADKVQLLREQGLTGAELQTLADFSNVKRFPGGTYLFHEGDPGNEMYVVLEGRVMISKYLPGGGEEALAILQRGDFFGEMSLVDGEPRSADAKAFQGPATVIAFDSLTLQEVQAVDPHASLDFIRLLCRLMAERLREIDEKLTSWRIMSGDRPEEPQAEAPHGGEHGADNA